MLRDTEKDVATLAVGKLQLIWLVEIQVMLRRCNMASEILSAS